MYQIFHAKKIKGFPIQIDLWHPRPRKRKPMIYEVSMVIVVMDGIKDGWRDNEN